VIAIDLIAILSQTNFTSAFVRFLMLIAVFIPCHNEEASIYTVITTLREEIPVARIVVCDNASSDRTAELALAAGAEVVSEMQKGQGKRDSSSFS
jgi:glycosyltransferase involved in cell wall biosynthesis